MLEEIKTFRYRAHCDIAACNATHGAPAALQKESEMANALDDGWVIFETAGGGFLFICPKCSVRQLGKDDVRALKRRST